MNVNRQEYRIFLGDEQCESPWILPPAPFAHTLDVSPLVGIRDNNAFLDTTEFSAALPSTYAQFVSDVNQLKREKKPRPSTTYNDGGKLKDATRNFLPQDLKWDLSLKGNPRLVVKIEDNVEESDDDDEPEAAIPPPPNVNGVVSGRRICLRVCAETDTCHRHLA